MRSLILFGSKYGTAEECAKKLKEKLKGDVDLINIKNSKEISISDYDKVIIGGSVYMGMINKEVKEFVECNKSELISKKIGLFMCCMSEGDKIIEQFNQNLPNEVLSAAKVKESFGGEFKFSKMNFFERQIIKMISKKDPKIGKINVKNDFNRIDEEAINRFAIAIGNC